MSKAQKTCFVICPIGDEGTQIRRQSDCLLEYIIKPSLDGYGFRSPIRVDKSDQPAHITTEIIQNLISADLVIADLSTLNANVFYELGIRHAYKKPCILLSDWAERPPFDVAGINTIKYVYDDPTSHYEVISRIRDQLESFEEKKKVSNPVTIAIGFEQLEESGDDLSQLFVQMSEKVDRLARHIDASVSLPSVGVIQNRNRMLDELDFEHKFKVGDLVRHEKFGNGLVKKVEGAKLDVEFERAGLKRIIARFVDFA